MSETIEATLGARITAAREGAGFTQDEVSRWLGLEPGIMEAWEAEEAEPHAYKLNRLAGLTGVSIVWLLGGEGPGPDMEADGNDAVLAAAVGDLGQSRALMEQAMQRIAHAEAVIARLRAGGGS